MKNKTIDSLTYAQWEDLKGREKVKIIFDSFKDIGYDQITLKRGDMSPVVSLSDLFGTEIIEIDCHPDLTVTLFEGSYISPYVSGRLLDDIYYSFSEIYANNR